MISKTYRNKWLPQAVTTVLALLLAAAPAAAEACDIGYRIWTKEGGSSYYDLGDEIVLESGQEVHLYIHHRSNTPKRPYSATAAIGYPADLGLKGDRARDVARHLKMKRQSSEDVREGRVEIEVGQEGRTALGYRISDISEARLFGQLPGSCRTGLVRFAITDQPRLESAQPAVDLGARQAAEKIVVRLYEGLLRRQQVSEYSEAMVTVILNDGSAGIARSASEIVASPEFRNQALERTRGAHDYLSNALKPPARQVLEDQLLNDIYQSLYGQLGLTADEYERHRRSLATCLEAGRNSQQACDWLGRALVEHRKFADHHRRLLTILEPGA